MTIIDVWLAKCCFYYLESLVFLFVVGVGIGGVGASVQMGTLVIYFQTFSTKNEDYKLSRTPNALCKKEKCK